MGEAMTSQFEGVGFPVQGASFLPTTSRRADARGVPKHRPARAGEPSGDLLGFLLRRLAGVLGRGAAPFAAGPSPGKGTVKRASAEPAAAKSTSRRPPARSGTGLRLETEERFRIVFEHSLEGIMMLLPDATIFSCNPAAGRMFGESPESMIGRSLAELVSCSPSQPATAGMPFPVGSYEAVAQRRDGASFPLELTVSTSSVGGESQLILMMRDITERKATQDRLAFLANYDSLTGLPNRVLFRDRLAGAMKRARRSGHEMGLMFLDLDRFKLINDSLGHAAGDLLLKYVATTLSRCLRSVDSVARNVDGDPVTVSRLGGDEFTIIVENVGGSEDAAAIARRILDALIEPFKVDGQEIFISASIGISMYPRDDSDLDGLIGHTDMAMYRSKAAGRGTYSFYRPDMSAEVAARLSLEAHLRHALERGEFVLHYQPKADLKTGAVTGVEALIRWHRPGEGMVPPDRFIAMLEDTGLILPVGAWVIRTACAQLAAWDRSGMPPISLAVNLSARQFRHQHLIQLIADTLLDSGIHPQRLELELTESQLMEDNDVSRELLSSLEKLGVKVAIDDFGTGHSSLSYLKRFNIDTLKIDRSFVREITNGEEDNAIATAVIALGHSLKLKVVAEGVETLHQAECLRELGCDEIQGYLLSKPLPPEQLAEWLRNYRSTRSCLRPLDKSSAPLPTITLELADAAVQ